MIEMTIFVNDRPVAFADNERFRTAGMIKARAGADIQYRLMKEQPATSDSADEFIGDCQTILLDEGDKFLLIPPCGF